jgi:hypothetical protein
MKKYVACVSGLALAGVLAAVGLLAGCSSGTSSSSGSASNSGPAVDGSKYVLAAEPEGAAEVIAVRESAKDGDDVVLVGRIGGEAPWNEGAAAFFVVDNSLRACSDRPGDECKTPWDYCCERSEDLAAATALVKVVDENGALVKVDTRKLLPVQELSTVVVKGKAKRDDAGNLTVLADGVYIKNE